MRFFILSLVATLTSISAHAEMISAKCSLLQGLEGPTIWSSVGRYSYLNATGDTETGQFTTGDSVMVGDYKVAIAGFIKIGNGHSAKDWMFEVHVYNQKTQLNGAGNGSKIFTGKFRGDVDFDLRESLLDERGNDSDWINFDCKSFSQKN